MARPEDTPVTNRPAARMIQCGAKVIAVAPKRLIHPVKDIPPFNPYLDTIQGFDRLPKRPPTVNMAVVKAYSDSERYRHWGMSEELDGEVHVKERAGKLSSER